MGALFGVRRPLLAVAEQILAPFQLDIHHPRCLLRHGAGHGVVNRGEQRADRVYGFPMGALLANREDGGIPPQPSDGGFQWTALSFPIGGGAVTRGQEGFQFQRGFGGPGALTRPKR